MIVVQESRLRAFQLTAPFDVNRIRAVYQDVGYRRVAHQRFQRSEPQRLVDQFIDKSFTVGLAQKSRMILT